MERSDVEAKHGEEEAAEDQPCADGRHDYDAATVYGAFTGA